MSRRPVRMLLEDILQRIRRVARFVRGMEREEFLADEKTCDSVVRNLEVIGEAAGRLPAEFRGSHPEVPWRRIIGLRNRVVHAYFDVDLELVWQIVQHELPELEGTLGRIANGLADDPGSGD